MFELTPFDRRERDFFRNFFALATEPQEQHPDYRLHVDLEDKGDHFELAADLPGFKPEEIKVDLEENVLTISAAHSEEHEVKEHNYVRRERRQGSYSRSFDMEGINTEAISGSFENGVLTLSLPKVEEPKPAKRSIQINGISAKEAGDEVSEKKEEAPQA